MSNDSTGYNLISLPLESVIVSGQFVRSRRLSIQSEYYSKTLEIRSRFEQFLSNNDCLIETHKLIFLDHFHDRQRKKAVIFKDRNSAFEVCNNYLKEIIHLSQESIIFNDVSSEFNTKLLSQFESLVTENEPIFPLLKKNTQIFEWFSKQQQMLLNTKAQEETATQEEEDNLLEMVLFTFYNRLNALFFYFQKSEKEVITEWMKENLSSLPKFILDDMKKVHESRVKFKENLVYREEDMNNCTILDSDFEFLRFLSNNTSDWKLMSKVSKLNETHVYGSKENYTSASKSKMYKFVYTINHPVEYFTKAFYSYDFSKEKMVKSEYWSYEPYDLNQSSKKYSIVKGQCIFDLNLPFFSERRTDAVFSTKSFLIGSKLAQSCFLFKTSSMVNNKRLLAMGGTFIQKLDENRCTLIEIKMFNVSGLLQTDLVMDNLGLRVYIKQLAELMDKMVKQLEEDKNNEQKERFLWKTFTDHTQSYYNVDGNKL